MKKEFSKIGLITDKIINQIDDFIEQIKTKTEYKLVFGLTNIELIEKLKDEKYSEFEVFDSLGGLKEFRDSLENIDDYVLLMDHFMYICYKDIHEGELNSIAERERGIKISSFDRMKEYGEGPRYIRTLDDKILLNLEVEYLKVISKSSSLSKWEREEVKRLHESPNI